VSIFLLIRVINATADKVWSVLTVPAKGLSMLKEADIKFPEIPFRKTAVLVVAGLALYLVYLYLAGLNNVKFVLLHANYRFLGLAVLVSLASNLFHAAGWWILLKDGMKYRISLLNAYLLYLSSTFFVNLIPPAAISGEVAKIYFVEKTTPEARFDKTAAACLMSRILETLPTTVIVVLGVIYLALYYSVPCWVLILCLIVAGVLILIALAALAVMLNNPLLRRVAAWSFRLLGMVFKGYDFSARAEHIDLVLKQFDVSLRSITDKPWLVVASLFFVFVAWGLDLAVAYLAFLTIEYHTSVLLITIIFSIIVILQLLPTFVPGGLGLIDGLMTVLYIALGISRDAATGATIMIRLVTLWFLTTLGAVVSIYLVKAYEKK
jgi:hypothetical protein